MTSIFGTATPAGDRFDLTFERIYATTVEDVWDAVTNPERLARWMSEYVGDLRLGGRWDALNDDGTVYASGSITACEPPRTYTTTWEYGDEPYSTVHITVAEHPEGALLRLHHEQVAELDYGAGWQTYLERLDESLPVAPSSEVDPDRTPGIGWYERFEQLVPAWRPVIEAAQRGR